ncbi:hypothetical protein ZOSMA_50G00310 [Zostera marina]|uniref:Pentatricopeptide repeat-containing protein n=1 Tax=Zostera marina TaxID=29655 RepID=A0A0K9P079_ZOSMR|nr:hypothetical protein ZOSMA_50G00310 [Zostera marina]
MTLIHIFFLCPRRPNSFFPAVFHRIQKIRLYRYYSQRSFLSGELGSIPSFHQLETHVRTQCSSLNFDNNAAIKLFDVMLSSNPSPSVSSFNTLLTRVGRLEDYPFVLSIYRTALGAGILSPNIYTHGILINSCCHMGRLDVGFGVLGDLIKRGWNLNVVVLSSLIDGLFKQYRVQDAMELFKKMPELECSPRPITYLIVITHLGKIYQIESGLAVLGCMMKSGGWPNTAIFNTLIYGFFKSKKIFDAINLLRRMLDMGCTADSITYNTIIIYCFQNNFFDIGFGIFTKVVKDGITLSVETVNSLIHGLCQADKLFEATSLVLRFLEFDFVPDVFTYSTLINGYCRSSDAHTVRLGFRVFGEMLKKGHHPNTVVYNALIKGLCAINRVGEAAALVLRFPKMDFTPNVITYGTLINGYCKNNKNRTVELGFRVFGEMLKRGHCPNTIVYNALVKGLCAINRVDEASVLVDKMYSKLGYPPNVITYTTLIKGLCTVNRVDEAGVLVDKMHDKLGCSPDVITYTTLINGLCCVGDTQGALKLLRDMGSNKKIHWCKPDKVTYLTIIYSLCRLGR